MFLASRSLRPLYIVFLGRALRTRTLTTGGIAVFPPRQGHSVRASVDLEDQPADWVSYRCGDTGAPGCRRAVIPDDPSLAALGHKPTSDTSATGTACARDDS